MEEKKIYQAIIGVMADIGAIGKNQVNEGYGKNKGYKFRGIDQVYNALQPALIKNGVFPVPIVEKEERTERHNDKGTVLFYSRLHIAYRFYANDGSFVEAKVIGEAMDSGDKATNKAMSAAYKYACFQVFCIPTEEMIDADKETHEVVPMITDPNKMLVTDNNIFTMIAKMKKKGIPEEKVLERFGKKDLKEFTMADFSKTMAICEKTPDKVTE